MSDIYEHIANGRYENHVPLDVPALVIDADTTTIARAEELRNEHATLKREQRGRYREEEARLNALFRADLEVEHGLVGHPKAERLFEMAWDRGHSGGFREVAEHYAELAELVQ